MAKNKSLSRREPNPFWRPPKYDEPIKNRWADPFYRFWSKKAQENARRRRRRWVHDWLLGWWYHPQGHILSGVRAWAVLAGLMFIPVFLFSYMAGAIGVGVCLQGVGCIASENDGLRLDADDSATVSARP